MGFARKLGDSWTVELNELVKEFNNKYRALNKVLSQKEAAADIEVLIRNKYPHEFQNRDGSGLRQRIIKLDRVLAGEEDKNRLMDYDKDYFGRLPRE